MKILIGFFIGCMLIGSFLPQKYSRLQPWLVFGLCVLLAVGYYYYRWT